MSLSDKLLSLITFIMGALILALPTAILALPKGGVLVALMLLISLLGLSLKRNKSKLNKWEWYFVLSFIGYFVVLALNLWWFDGDLKELDSPSRMLLVLPIFFYIKSLNINTSWLYFGMTIGAIFAGFIKFGWIDISYVSKVVTVQTGIFSLFASIYALSSLFFINKENSTIVNIVFFLAFVSGALGSYLSGGRGVWIASFLTFAIMLWINPAKWKNKMKYIALFLFLGVFLLSYSVPQTGVKNRIDAATTNVINFIKNDDAQSSSGARLEMWKVSYEIIKDNFMIGVGEDNYNQHQQKLIAQGKADMNVGNFKHPHNEYISSFVEQGIFGFLTTAFVMLLPILYFLSPKQKKWSCAKYSGAAAVGICTSLHYLFYSFTANVFAHQSSTLFYVIILVISIGLSSQGSRLLQVEHASQ